MSPRCLHFSSSALHPRNYLDNQLQGNSTPDLAVTETAAPNPVATGATITYTETVTNNSMTVAAAGATLTQNTRCVRDEPLHVAADGSEWRGSGRAGVVWFHHGAAAGIHGPGAIADTGRGPIRALGSSDFDGQVQDHRSRRAAHVDPLW